MQRESNEIAHLRFSWFYFAIHMIYMQSNKYQDQLLFESKGKRY